MKHLKLFITFLLAPVFWGVTKIDGGHEIIVRIAEKHLTAYSKYRIKTIFLGQSMADFKLWDVESKAHKNLANSDGMHFIELPVDLKNEGELEYVLKSANKNNISKLILKQEQLLRDTLSTLNEQRNALILLVNLIEDIHQPVCIILRNGNKLVSGPRQFSESKSLYLTRKNSIIGGFGNDYSGIADSIDNTASVHIKGGPLNEDPVHWLWESYKIAASMEKKGIIIKQPRYDSLEYRQIVVDRLELAGIRLSHVLNLIYKEPGKTRFISPSSSEYYEAAKSPYSIDVKEAHANIGKIVAFKDMAYSHKNIGGDIEVYIGAKYPDQFITLILKGISRTLAKHIDGRIITVAGLLSNQRGKPVIIISDPRMLTVKPKT